MDIWLYFFRHAEKMDTEALPAAIENHPLVRRAVEELKMLAQTDSERERYEARRKAQLDYNTGLKVARLEGRDEGLSEGLQKGLSEGLQKGLSEGLQKGLAAEKIHTIHLLERSLQRSETSAEQLAQRSLEELSQLIDQLLAEMSRPR